MTVEMLFNLLFTVVLLAVVVVVVIIIRTDTRGYLRMPDGGGNELPQKSVSKRIRLNITMIAWKNMWRKKMRTLLLLLALATTGTVISGSYFLNLSISHSLDAGAGRLGADLVVVPKGSARGLADILISGIPTSFYMDEEISAKVKAVQGVEAVSAQLYLTTYAGDCCGVFGNYPVVGFDPRSDFTLKDWLIGGEELGDHGVIVGRTAGGYNAFYDVDQSVMEDRLELLGEQFFVKNVLFPTGTGTDKTLFIPLKTAQLLAATNPHIDIEPHQISALMVKLKSGVDPHPLQLELERFAGVEVVSSNELIGSIRDKIGPIKILLTTAIILFLVMTLAQLAVTFSAMINERQRELAFFRVMGGTKTIIAKLVIWEIVFLCGLGSLSGALVTSVLLYDYKYQLIAWFNLPLVFPSFWTAVASGLASSLASIVIGIAAAMFPLFRMIRMDTYDAIREGE